MEFDKGLLTQIKEAFGKNEKTAYDESSARSIELLIENETLNKKAFAIKRDKAKQLICLQNGKIDPFTASGRMKLGFSRTS